MKKTHGTIRERTTYDLTKPLRNNTNTKKRTITIVKLRDYYVLNSNEDYSVNKTVLLLLFLQTLVAKLPTGYWMYITQQQQRRLRLICDPVIEDRNFNRLHRVHRPTR